MNKEVLDLGKIESTTEHKHTPSSMQADTLFTFSPRLEYILPIIREKMISPRYCDENIEYLKIPQIKRIAFPMKCFCDINLHRIEEHLEWYGHYGLAFTKEWGMKNKIQPVQYINPESDLCADFSTAFSDALSMGGKSEIRAGKNMRNYMLHELMYYKPYEGDMQNRNTEEVHRKCFTDECEWRYIPDVTPVGYKQIYYDEKIVNAGVLDDISNSMFGIGEISLKFEYSDLKYIIIKSVSEFRKLVDEIYSIIEDDEANMRDELISKIIIWDRSKGDF